MMQGFEVTELDRRLSNLIQVGTVLEADYPNAKLKVKIGDITTDWLPWLTMRASNDTTWWSPEIGEQVMVLAPSGELKQAVILSAIYQNAHPAIDDNDDVSKTVYKDGTITRYNRDTHVLTVDVNKDGKVEIIIGASTITMTNTNIELKNGGSSILITDSNIKLSTPRIDLN
ncbi:MAG: phage baseplate assembly protein V [Proteobacteria bacterium]|nr:phage baseplate assembly protein V [Pseudomonadota bacterium]